MLSEKEIRGMLYAQLRVLVVGAGGVITTVAAAPSLYLVAMGATGLLAAVEALKVRNIKRRDATLRRLVVEGSASREQLLKKLHGDAELVFAVFYEKGKFCYAIVGHRDPGREEELRQSGALVSYAEVDRRADRRCVMYLGR